jgi:hypothetical protein
MLRLTRGGDLASPNALSAYRRLGLAADLVGAHWGRQRALVGRATPVDEAIAVVVAAAAAHRGGRGEGANRSRAGHPLLPGGRRTGAVVLVRDVDELRHRERELVSKDRDHPGDPPPGQEPPADVAALLRLQARRLDEPAARSALDEAVRRVASIAVVHETLSQSLDETVAFDAIATGSSLR